GSSDRSAITFRRIERLVAGVADIFERQIDSQVFILAEGIVCIRPFDPDTGGNLVLVCHFIGQGGETGYRVDVIGSCLAGRGLDAGAERRGGEESAGFYEGNAGGVIEVSDVLRVAQPAYRALDPQLLGLAEQVAVAPV